MRLPRAFDPVVGKIAQSPGILRAVIVVGSVVIASIYPLVFVGTLFAMVIWLLPRAIQGAYERHPRQPPPDPVTEAFAEFLQLELAEAREQIAHLQKEVEAAKRSAKERPSERMEPRGHPVFRRVGLDQDCPHWVAEVVRREYRKRLHPDGKPLAQKPEAERRFKQAEQTFAEIWHLRGF